MRPLPPTASQEKSHIPSWSAKQYLAPLMRPQKFPYIPISLEGTLKFPAPLHLRPFSSHDRDRRVDSTALSRRDSRPSRHTSGWGRSHEEIRDEPRGWGHMPNAPDSPVRSWEGPEARTPLRRQPCGWRHNTKGLARLLCPRDSPRDIPNPGMESRSPTLLANSLPSEPLVADN